jgi:hypothetical protein
MGVEVRVAREMARLVASASAICGREVAWNLGRLWPREIRRFVILTSLVQPETACGEGNGSKRHRVEYSQQQCELSNLDLGTEKATVIKLRRNSKS